MPRLLVAFVSFFFAGCAPYKPLPDSGTPQDAAASDAAKEAATCVPDFQACTAASVCCSLTSSCNVNAGVCETCEKIGAICSSNSQCCSGICNGTCE